MDYALDRLAREPFDPAHRELINRRYNRDCLTLIACPAGPAYSMHVIFRRCGHVVIDDVRNGVYVQPTGGDISRD